MYNLFYFYWIKTWQ